VTGAEHRLVPLTAESIRALAAHPEEPLVQEGLAGLVWPEDDLRVLRYRAEALTADPEAWPWLLHAVLDEAGELVGRIGCHAPPHDGRVEVGYYVRPDARGRGVATAVLAAFTAWLQDRGVGTVVLAIRPDNTASLRIARAAGFVQVGEQWDEEDGLELVLETALGAEVRG
jgi:[ribosomal protein S5]-alanine N-acetyltransferase